MFAMRKYNGFPAAFCLLLLFFFVGFFPSNKLAPLQSIYRKCFYVSIIDTAIYFSNMLHKYTDSLGTEFISRAWFEIYMCQNAITRTGLQMMIPKERKKSQKMISFKKMGQNIIFLVLKKRSSIERLFNRIKNHNINEHHLSSIIQ